MNTERFREAILNSLGYAPPSEIPPGKIERFPTSDKRGDDNGWCRFFDDCEGGVFGCWRQGISEIWHLRKPRTPEDKAAFQAKVKQAQEEAERQREQERADCREKSAELWSKGRDVDAKHPYLVAKNVKPYGVKQLKDSLLIPVRDATGVLQGLQFIGLDGSKKFKTGTAVTGCYHSIGKPKDKLLVAEGYATAATVHEITGYAVAVAFNAGNLKPVAEALRAKLPDITLIICADDDHSTEGNPGLTKATEAARAVNGLLAVPSFPDNRGAKDTDFNDLAKLAGAEAVKVCIEDATPVAPILTPQDNPWVSAIDRLAKLSPHEYDRTRKEEAKKLGVRPATLDNAVKAAQREAEQIAETPFHEVEPHPEPVDGSELLTALVATIKRFIVCEQHTAIAVALWIVMTWFMDVVKVAPRAIITAPEKRCGKTLLLTLIGKLAPRALTSSSITPSALFRAIDLWNPTLLIDETDACLKENEELRGLINSGHTRESAYTVRCVGDDHTPTKFSTWCAMGLSGIGNVADTIMDRSIILELRRKLPHEKVERIRHAEDALFQELSAKLARFAEDNAEAVHDARPVLPEKLNDRAQDNWEPLLAIAMVAGGEWFKSGTAAALKLSGSDGENRTIGTELLSDIQEIFTEQKLDRISTADLIKALCADDEKTWATYNRGFPIKPRQLASKLKGYGIHSKSIRMSTYETPKGYERSQFEDAFFRYVSIPPDFIRHTPQMAISAGLPVAESIFQGDEKTETQRPKAATSADCGVVADRNPLQVEVPNFDV
ncbi:MAG: DNA primase [Geobacter sp.]|nr:MAG: DNA primase [Geobacter sp.]